MTVFQNVRRGLIPARPTVDEVYALTEAGMFLEDDNFTLIDGEIVPIAAAKASRHEMMKSQLNRALILATEPEVRLFVEASITLSQAYLVGPDLCLCPNGIQSREVRGPDVLLAIEVSGSSISYDLRVKAPLYARFGVRDYWVVDAVRRTIRVHRDPVDGVYRDVEEYEAHDIVPALLIPRVAIRLDALD